MDLELLLWRPDKTGVFCTKYYISVWLQNYTLSLPEEYNLPACDKQSSFCHSLPKHFWTSGLKTKFDKHCNSLMLAIFQIFSMVLPLFHWLRSSDSLIKTSCEFCSRLLISRNSQLRHINKREQNSGLVLMRLGLQINVIFFWVERGRLLKSLIFKAQAYTTSISLDRARECLLHVHV